MNFYVFHVLDEDWEEEHEKLAEYIGDVQSKTESSKPLELYSLEDDDECAYPGPQPRNLRDARIDKTGNVAFEADNDDDAANVAASVSQIILDDDMEDIESIISRPINFSRTMESKVILGLIILIFHSIKISLMVKLISLPYYTSQCCLNEILMRIHFLLDVWQDVTTVFYI